MGLRTVFILCLKYHYHVQLYHSVKLHDDAKKHHIVVIMIHIITITNTTNNHSITYSTLKYSSTNPPTSSININSIVYLHSIHSYISIPIKEQDDSLAAYCIIFDRLSNNPHNVIIIKWLIYIYLKTFL
jgi:hypothetical protein